MDNVSAFRRTQVLIRLTDCAEGELISAFVKFECTKASNFMMLLTFASPGENLQKYNNDKYID